MGKSKKEPKKPKQQKTEETGAQSGTMLPQLKDYSNQFTDINIIVEPIFWYLGTLFLVWEILSFVVSRPVLIPSLCIVLIILVIYYKITKHFDHFLAIFISVPILLFFEYKNQDNSLNVLIVIIYAVSCSFLFYRFKGVRTIDDKIREQKKILEFIEEKKGNSNGDQEEDYKSVYQKGNEILAELIYEQTMNDFKIKEKEMKKRNRIPIINPHKFGLWGALIGGALLWLHTKLHTNQNPDPSNIVYGTIVGAILGAAATAIYKAFENN